MGNFIGLAFSTLKKAGIDTKNMSIEEVIAKYNEINVSNSSKPLTESKSGVKIFLPKQEYAQICSAINTKNANYKGNRPKRDAILHGNYKYYYKNGKDFGDFTITRKVLIDNLEWRKRDDN